MQQANWTSLGIIVTLLACMAHRLVSSKRDTKNASAASCRHMMALPWKHMSVLPTSWAISRTSPEKGSFRIRSSVLFWYRQISWRATVPGWYFLVFLTFPAFQEFLLWGLASNGRMEFPSGRLPPTQMAQLLQPSGPTVGSAIMMVTDPLPPAYSPPQPTQVISSSTCTTSLVGEELLAGEGWCTGEGGCFLVTSSFLAHLASRLSLLLSPLFSSSCLAWLARWARSFFVWSTVLPSLSFLGVVFVLTMLFEKWKEKVVVKGNNYQEIQFEKQRKENRKFALNSKIIW